MQPLTRRRFLATSSAALAGAALSACQEASPMKRPAATPTGEATRMNLPLIDYHVHLDDLGIDKTAANAQAKGVKFGVVEHAGSKVHSYPRYPVILASDDELRAYMKMLEGKGVYKGIQAEGLDWMKFFSRDTIAQLDYVLTDALTLPGGPDKSNGFTYIWLAEIVQIDDAQKWMDMYVDHHVRICATEPIDILANVTFLPAVLADQYDALWTEARLRKLVDALVKHDVVLEISTKSKLPKAPLLKLAKAAGCRFSFGTNARKAPDQGDLAWGLAMARELGLTPADLFTPAPPRRKPVEVRRFG
jgi:histidinol phosphatase-like PHP family hydrolase